MSNRMQNTFEDPDPTFFEIDMPACTLQTKSTKEISTISFDDVQEAKNFHSDSFGQEIKNIVSEAKQDLDDLELG